MMVVRTVDEFYRQNDEEMRRMVQRVWPCDRETLKDRMQAFYLDMVRYKTLDRYDPKKGAFTTFTMNAYRWTIKPEMATTGIPNDLSVEPDYDLTQRLHSYAEFVKASGCKRLGAVIAEMERRMEDMPVENRSAASHLRRITRDFLERERDSDTGYTGVKNNG